MPAFHDVAALDEYGLCRDVFNGQFIYLLRFPDDNLLLIDGFFEREEAFPSAFAMDQEYGKVLVRVRSGDSIFSGRADC